MTKVAMLVFNACNPDYRVIKEAESLARDGMEVRIFCLAKPGVPERESINGVDYLRLPLAKDFWQRKPAAAAAPRVAPAAGIRAVPKPSIGTDCIGTAGTAAASAPAAAACGVQVTVPPAAPIATSLPARALRAGLGLGRRVVRASRSRSLKLARAVINRSRGLGRSGTKRLRELAHVASGPARNVLAKRRKFAIATATFAPSIVAWKPDVVHAHDLVCLPAGHAAANAVGARLVYDSHELETHRNPPLPWTLQRFYARIERHYIRRCDAVITVCEPIARHLERCYRIRRPIVIYNAPSLDRLLGRREQLGWRQSPAAIRDIRAEAGVPEGGLLGIYVGLVTINRGIETMIDALARLPDTWLAAVGPSSNLQLVAGLKQRAADLGVADRFAILPPVHPDQVVEFIEGADFGVNPLNPVTLSYNYAMPNKIFEMSLAGLAIVNSDAAETARFVRDNGLGVIFRSADPADCARAIVELASDIGRYKPSAEKLAGLRNRYAWHRQEQTLQRLYDSLLLDRLARPEPEIRFQPIPATA